MTQPTVEVFASGMNSALQRAPRLKTIPVPLSPMELVCERWRPLWPTLRTVGLRFPEAPDPPPKPAPVPKSPGESARSWTSRRRSSRSTAATARRNSSPASATTRARNEPTSRPRPRAATLRRWPTCFLRGRFPRAS